MWGVFWELVDNRARQGPSGTTAPPCGQVPTPVSGTHCCITAIPHTKALEQDIYLCSHVCGSSRVLWISPGLGGGGTASPPGSCGPSPPTHLTQESRLKAQQSPWEHVLMATAETWDAERTCMRPPVIRNGTLSLLWMYHQVKQIPWPSPAWRGREMHAVCEKGKSVWMHRRLRSWAHTTVYWSLYDIALSSLVWIFWLCMVSFMVCFIYHLYLLVTKDVS